jgi:GntR family transcriptional regulator
MVAGARVLSASLLPAGLAARSALRLAEGEEVYEVRRIRLADGRPIVLERSLFPAFRFPGMLDCRLDGWLYELLFVWAGRERAPGHTVPVRRFRPAAGLGARRSG